MNISPELIYPRRGMSTGGKILLFVFVLLLLLAIGYGIWIVICYVRTKKWSPKPCNLFAKDGKVENLRLEYFQTTNSYSVVWDAPSSFGNDDSKYASYDYYLWKGVGNYTSKTTDPAPDQKGNTKDTSFVIESSLVQSGQEFTVVVVAKNRFSDSPDARADLTIPNVPHIESVSFKGITPGPSISMSKNPTVDVVLKKGYGTITDKKVSIEVTPLPPQTASVIDATSCNEIQNDTISCIFGLADENLYGGTSYIPQASVTNTVGTSPVFKSASKYVEQEVAPGSPTNVRIFRPMSWKVGVQGVVQTSDGRYLNACAGRKLNNVTCTQVLVLGSDSNNDRFEIDASGNFINYHKGSDGNIQKAYIIPSGGAGHLMFESAPSDVVWGYDPSGVLSTYRKSPRQLLNHLQVQPNGSTSNEWTYVNTLKQTPTSLWTFTEKSF